MSDTEGGAILNNALMIRGWTDAQLRERIIEVSARIDRNDGRLSADSSADLDDALEFLDVMLAEWRQRGDVAPWGVFSYVDGVVYHVDPPTREKAEYEASLLRQSEGDEKAEYAEAVLLDVGEKMRNAVAHSRRRIVKETLHLAAKDIRGLGTVSGMVNVGEKAALWLEERARRVWS